MKTILKTQISQGDGHPCGTRGYASEADRDRAIAALRKTHGANYFVKFRDVQSPFALSWGWAHWVPKGTIHIG